MTLNRHWGYYLGDEDFKSTETVVRHLIDIASKGGNFLLNVGPTGEGAIPAGSTARLREIGAWLERNGEAVYGTTASAIPQPAWGRITQKAGPDGVTVYLHVFAWPTDGRLRLPLAIGGGITAAVLTDGTRVAVTRHPGGVELAGLPAVATDPISTTVILQTRAPLSR